MAKAIISERNVPLVFFFQVGNKADLADRREVQLEAAVQFAAGYGIPYIETSVLVKSNIQVRGLGQVLVVKKCQNLF